MSSSPSRRASHRSRLPERGALRIAALAGGVAASGCVLGLLLGPPAGHLAPSGGVAQTLDGRLSDASLRQVLTWCCWACWVVLALVAATAGLMPRRRRSVTAAVPVAIRAGTGGAAAAAAAGDANGYAGPSETNVSGAAATLEDDTMGDPLAWDERPTDPGGRTGRGSAEARMTIEITDGGMVAGDGRRKRELRRGRETVRPAAAPTPLPALPPRPAADEPAPQPAHVEADDGPPACTVQESVLATGGVVRVPLEAAGEPSIALTSLGSLAVLGDDDDVADLFCSMVVDAAAGRLSPAADVVLAGFGEAMHGLDGIVAVHDEREAVRLANAAGTTAPGGRGATIVFVGVRRDPPALRDLLALVSPRAAGLVEADDDAGCADGDAGDHRQAGLAVVVAGDCAEARWRLDLRAGSLDEALVRQLGLPSPATAEGAGLPAPQPAASVEISVLGPVRVTGTAVPFEGRPKLTELVIYLALHPDGATTDAWATALWPDRRMPMSTLSNRLSETRLSLGYAPDGFAHLRKRGGRYHLGPFVTTDWDRFLELAAADDAVHWRSALTLVRGRPFEGLREAQWTLLEGVVPGIESAVVELACRLAEHLLASRDPEGAEWAARRAMLACPWDERLYRLVMRAADAAGNRAGVEAALRQLACVLELGEEPLSAVHPETASLYRSLTNRRAIL